MLTSEYAPSKQAGNGVTVAFSGSFKILQASDLAVYKIDASGNQGGLLVLGTDYTVAFDPIAETWTVTYTVAPVSGGFAYILRVSNNQQQTSLPREGPFPAKTVESMVDKVQAQIQELAAAQAAIVVPTSFTLLSGSYAAMNALALLNPTLPFAAIITDYKMVGFYTGNINLGSAGWWFLPGGS